MTSRLHLASRRGAGLGNAARGHPGPQSGGTRAMKTSTQLKPKAVDALLGGLLPMQNDISSSAWYVKEGKWQYSKHRRVGEQLQEWLSKNQAMLPPSVTSPVSRLNTRILEWASSSGGTATPENFATDEKDSFLR